MKRDVEYRLLADAVIAMAHKIRLCADGKMEWPDAVNAAVRIAECLQRSEQYPRPVYAADGKYEPTIEPLPPPRTDEHPDAKLAREAGDWDALK